MLVPTTSLPKENFKTGKILKNIELLKQAGPAG